MFMHGIHRFKCYDRHHERSCVTCKWIHITCHIGCPVYVALSVQCCVCDRISYCIGYPSACHNRWALVSCGCVNTRTTYYIPPLTFSTHLSHIADHSACSLYALRIIRNLWFGRCVVCDMLHIAYHMSVQCLIACVQNIVLHVYGVKWGHEPWFGPNIGSAGMVCVLSLFYVELCRFPGFTLHFHIFTVI